MYEKARRGETVELSPRRISIFQFDIERSLDDRFYPVSVTAHKQFGLVSLNTSRFSSRRQNLIFRVVCSKGTYIRSLCADLAKALGR